jgi:hypothetical protein
VRVSTTAQTNNNVKIILKMKKNLFFLLFLAIIAVSCQKDINPTVVADIIEQPKTDYFHSVTPPPSPNDDIVQRIEAFNARIETPSNLGVGDPMSVNDAIWGIEAVLNQRYSNASKPFIAQQIDSANFTVPLSATGDINTNDVATALVTAKQALRQQWDRVRESAKHVIVTDIALRSQDATTATFTIASSIGIEQMLRDGLPPPVPFGLGEGWMDSKDGNGANLAGCALSSGQFGNAADKIVAKWTHRWIHTTNDYFYTDVDFIHLSRLSSNPKKDISETMYADSLIFSTSVFVLPTCITDVPHDDVKTLNHYLSGVPLFIDALKPIGKTYITLSMEGVREINTSNNGRCHRAIIQYGVAHFAGDQQCLPCE